MDMRKDIVRTRNRKEEGTSNSAKARRRLRDQLLAKGAYTKVEFGITIYRHVNRKLTGIRLDINVNEILFSD